VRLSAWLLATWFGVGKFPWGPGTAGSLAALIIAYVLRTYLGFGRIPLLLLICGLTLPSIWAAGRTARDQGKADPGMVVVDEVLGQWIVLLGAAAESWIVYLVAFVLFRLFDIWKPGPIRKLEALPGGFGIIADDMGAGILGALLLWLGRSLKVY
jgi:phosphatidylglycerophosphatase A